MQLIFVHGWSVTTTATYGQLPDALAEVAASAGLDITIEHIHLGKYVSFRNEVNLDDIARGFNQALSELPNNQQQLQPFSCITHSTGGPVVRHWIDQFYGPDKLEQLPLRHLVMLAPANHGSALAVLGQKRVSRISSWFKNIEPGLRILDWLSLGSLGQRTLNRNALDFDYVGNGIYPFVLTGQGIDRELYDFINSYLVERGSDGVVRVAGASMNYSFFALKQSDEVLNEEPFTTRLIYDEQKPLRTSTPVPIGVYRKYSHSGGTKGIMFSVEKSPGVLQPVVADIVKCLQIENSDDYQQRSEQLAQLTKTEQQLHHEEAGVERYAMLIFHIHDDQGNHFSHDDYDILLLGGSDYQPHELPKGFFIDRQMNRTTSNLVYYIDADRMQNINDGMFGIRVVAQPDSGFARYCMAEFRSDGVSLGDVLVANQTTYVDITVNRCVDKNVFRFARGDEERGRFDGVVADGGDVER